MAIDMQVLNRRRLFNGIRVGDIELVRTLLGNGVDANQRSKRGRPALIAAVRARIPESGVVSALLDAGADPTLTDELGRTALELAKARLDRLLQKRERDRMTRSASLDAHGNLVLGDEETAWLAQVRRDAPEIADELGQMYIQERRKAALRQVMPRRELRIIVQRLEGIATR